MAKHGPFKEQALLIDLGESLGIEALLLYKDFLSLLVLNYC